MNKTILPITLTLLAALGFAGCETSGQNALAGAATGAAIGGLLHGRGSDALRGAAIGAAGGYLIGKAAQYERRRGYEQGYYDSSRDDRDYYRDPNRDYYRDDYRDRYDRYDDRDYPRTYSTRYPVGRMTRTPGIVISPYPPYNRIEVHRIPRGAQVVDPSCNRVFINP
jgi:hypothetical protein